jgi:hypothetical protein
VFDFAFTGTSRRALARAAVVTACLTVVALGVVTWLAGPLVAVVAFWSGSAAAFIALLHFETHDLTGDGADSLDELTEGDRDERVAA